MNPKVDEYLLTAGKWRDELTELRRIALACGLTEMIHEAIALEKA